MSKIFITGAADGLGQLCAGLLVREGHEVVLHARDARRGREALKKTPGAADVLLADLSNLEETEDLARQVNALGPFDAVIHNAAVYHAPGEQIFAVNTLAPYVLTCLIRKPKRLIYMSSGRQVEGQPNFDYFKKKIGRISYADSKLHVMMLTLAAARRWPDVYSNAVDPGWVATKMGGKDAPDDLQKGYETQAWLAVSNDENAKASGRFLLHQKERPYNSVADDVTLQEKLLTQLEDMTGISLPA